jgi:lactoylglutathione lyase
MKINYAIVFVSDMAKSVHFYKEILGLPLKFETSHWSEFATDGAALALHLADDPNPDNTTDEHAGHCRPGLQVTDLAAFHQKMLDNKVPCIQPPKDVFGSKIAQYTDPDGLVFSVAEIES